MAKKVDEVPNTPQQVGLAHNGLSLNRLVSAKARRLQKVKYFHPYPLVINLSFENDGAVKLTQVFNVLPADFHEVSLKGGGQHVEP